MPLADEVAAMLDADKTLYPYISDLLKDLDALGSDPGMVVNLLRTLDLPPENTSVLDLGCGKGAVSLAIAEGLGFRVTGVDGYPPFIEDARKHAKELGLDSLCEFHQGDMRDHISGGALYDVVLMMSIGNLLGGPFETIGMLRKPVKNGGYIMLDWDYSPPGVVNTSLNNLKKLRRLLTSHNDSIVVEYPYPPGRMRRINEDIISLIRGRVRELAGSTPELAGNFEGYLLSQKLEVAALDKNTRASIWILRKN